MAGFQCRAHHIGIAGRVEGVVGAAVGHLHDRRDRLFTAHALRIAEVGHPELAAPLFAIRVDVDADDLVRARKPRTLDHVQSDAAEPEDADFVADLDLCGVVPSADALGPYPTPTRKRA